jgi:hypothetical protein
MSTRSPFFDGALHWLCGEELPDRCLKCGYEWSTEADAALLVIADAPSRYAALLDGRDGMTAPADNGWNATAYLWHLTDLARSWSERWVQLSVSPGSTLVGWDPDALAEARNYRRLPTSPALWALPVATAAFVTLSEQLDPATLFEHADWGPGTVADATRWLAHEYLHHQLDVDERAGRV